MMVGDSFPSFLKSSRTVERTNDRKKISRVAPFAFLPFPVSSRSPKSYPVEGIVIVYKRPARISVETCISSLNVKMCSHGKWRHGKRDNYKFLRIEHALLSSLINLYIGVVHRKISRLTDWLIDTPVFKLLAAANREYLPRKSRKNWLERSRTSCNARVYAPVRGAINSYVHTPTKILLRITDNCWALIINCV